MRILMHIIPHIAMIGLIIFICIVGIKYKWKWLYDQEMPALIFGWYLVFFSWIPSLLVETLLY